MANQEHLEILKQGVDVWNKWRRKNDDQLIDFSKADVSILNLRNVNFRNINFSRANFRGTNLINADLRNANLSGADFRDAKVRNADFSKAKLIGIDIRNADIRGTKLRNTDCGGANFSSTDMRDSDIRGSNFIVADFTGTDLRNADIRGADLIKTALQNADITGAKLYGTARDDWKIDGVKCDYVFWDKDGKERTPKDRDFRSGEFEELYKQLPTIEYYFENGFTPIDTIVIDKVVQAINEKHPEFELKLDSFHSRGQPHAVFTVLHKEYADEAIRQIKLDYETKIRVIEAERNLLERLFTKAIEQPRNFINTLQTGNFIEDRSSNIHAGGNVIESTLIAGNDNKTSTKLCGVGKKPSFNGEIK